MQHKEWFTVCLLESDELEHVNIVSANKFAMLCSTDLLCLLHCTALSIELTDGCRYFPRGPHVGQPPSRRSLTALEGNQGTPFAFG
jgi:hypothetical protein